MNLALRGERLVITAQAAGLSKTHAGMWQTLLPGNTRIISGPRPHAVVDRINDSIDDSPSRKLTVAQVLKESPPFTDPKVNHRVLHNEPYHKPDKSSLYRHTFRLSYIF